MEELEEEMHLGIPTELMNASLSQRRVLIFDEIDNEKSHEVIEKLLFLDGISHDPIEIIINSVGGVETDGWAIVDCIMSLKSPVTGIVYGQASSMASLIILACDYRKISKNSFVMIHSGYISTDSTQHQLEKITREVTKGLEKCIGFYTQNTKLTARKLKKMLMEDTTFNAKEALKNGFVDEII